MLTARSKELRACRGEPSLAKPSLARPCLAEPSPAAHILCASQWPLALHADLKAAGLAQGRSWLARSVPIVLHRRHTRRSERSRYPPSSTDSDRIVSNVTVTLTPAQSDDAVRLVVENGYSTAAVARLLGVSRRRVQELVRIAAESTEAEVAEAREAYRALVAQRGERLPTTDEERRALLDEIFDGPNPFDPDCPPPTLVSETDIAGWDHVASDVDVAWLGRADGQPVHPAP